MFGRRKEGSAEEDCFQLRVKIGRILTRPIFDVQAAPGGPTSALDELQCEPPAGRALAAIREGIGPRVRGAQVPQQPD
jgi:hypothetical protein